MHSHDPTASLMRIERRMRGLALHHTGNAGQAAAEHLAAGGSRVRALLALDACAALRVPRDLAEAVAAACELLHNASLVHDDLQDRDPFRRGQQAVWRRHGEVTAICVGDLLLSAAYGALAATGEAASELMTRMHRRVGAVIRGQCEDLLLQGQSVDSLQCYERVAGRKSGPLLILPLELSLVLGGHAGSVGLAAEAGSLFAIGYQAADDLDDIGRDALNEELNIVAVFAARGHTDPLNAARQLAIARFERCAAIAATLPSGSGALLAALASRRAALLAGAEASV